MTATDAPVARNVARLSRRLICLIYESLLLVAVVAATALPVVMLSAHWPHAAARAFLQAALVLVCGVYFVWQWSRSGQTLAMKTWRLKVVTRNGGLMKPPHATARYLLALAGTLLCGAGFLWALLDRESKFLHDRLAGTIIINTSD